MLLYVVVVEVCDLSGLVLSSLRIPLCMSAILVMWVLLFGLVVLICGHVRIPPMGVRLCEGYVGPCFAVHQITGALIGLVVVDDAGVGFDLSYVGGISFHVSFFDDVVC